MSQNKRLPNVYIIDEDGRGLSDGAVDALAQIYYDNFPCTAYDAVATISGTACNNLGHILTRLKNSPTIDRDLLILILPDETEPDMLEMVPSHAGPGTDGIRNVIRLLEKAFQEDPGQTTWSVLAKDVRSSQARENSRTGREQHL